jgi:antitoxin VapB
LKPKIAKLFTTGGSQAVRLPAEFRFAHGQVYIRRDERTGDVILSERPNRSWAEFMRFRDEQELESGAESILAQRSVSSETRDPFADWIEC